MIVLGFDTATASTAVALRLADGRTLQARDDPASGERPGHATRLLAIAGELLERAEVAWSALERIAVGVGPGRFTGLRVGIATARGLAQSLSVELVGVSSLQALAAGAGAHAAGGGVLAVIDARRGEAFAGAYDVTEDMSLTELESPRALVPEELGGRACAGRAGGRGIAPPVARDRRRGDPLSRPSGARGREGPRRPLAAAPRRCASAMRPWGERPCGSVLRGSRCRTTAAGRTRRSLWIASRPWGRERHDGAIRGPAPEPAIRPLSRFERSPTPTCRR